jgi:hypothetical protein
MKTVSDLNVVIGLLIALWVIIFCPILCFSLYHKHDHKYGNDTVVIENCEYIRIVESYTHKGNCSNPIHPVNNND